MRQAQSGTGQVADRVVEERVLTTAKAEAPALLDEHAEAPLAEIDELRTLLTQGRERGFLTFEEVSSCLEEVDVTKEQVRDLRAYFVEHGIDIVSADGKPAESEIGKIEAAAARGKDPVAPKKVELDLTVEPSLDSLRLYLRSIGKVELLTAA